MKKSLVFAFVLVLIVACIGLVSCDNNEIQAEAAVENMLLYPIYVDGMNLQNGQIVNEFELGYNIEFVNGQTYYLTIYVERDNRGADTRAGQGLTYYATYDSSSNFLKFNLYEMDPINDSGYIQNVEFTNGSNIVEVGFLDLTISFYMEALSIYVENEDGSITQPATTWYNYTISVDRITLPTGSSGTYNQTNVSNAFNALWNTYPNVSIYDGYYFKDYTINILNTGTIVSSRDITLYAFADSVLIPSLPMPSFYYAYPTLNDNTGSSLRFNNSIYDWYGTAIPIDNSLSIYYGDNAYIYVTTAYFRDTKPTFSFSVTTPIENRGSLGYSIVDSFTGLTYNSTEDFHQGFGNEFKTLLYSVQSSSITSEPLFGTYGTSEYSNGYADGFKAGKEAVNKSDIKQAYENGVQDGKALGRLEQLNKDDYTFLGLMSSVIDAPLTVFRGMFNVDILGVNLSSFFFGLFTIALIIAIIRLVL